MIENMQFQEFPKMSRLSREIIVTEKIDGTNASITITNTVIDKYPEDSNIIATLDGFNIRTGSRTRWITPKDDNFGSSNWVFANKEEIVKLGEGTHFGEWWGSGIQRGYELPKGEKRFSLFNTFRWSSELRPSCCSVVPVLYQGLFETNRIEQALFELKQAGSVAAPRFMKPEGVVVFHIAGNVGFKKTIEKDETPKSLVK